MILIDGPPIGLSLMVSRAVFHLPRAPADDGTSVLMVAQNVRSALAMADRVLLPGGVNPAPASWVCSWFVRIVTTTTQSGPEPGRRRRLAMIDNTTVLMLGTALADGAVSPALADDDEVQLFDNVELSGRCAQSAGAGIRPQVQGGARPGQRPQRPEGLHRRLSDQGGDREEAKVRQQAVRENPARAGFSAKGHTGLLMDVSYDDKGDRDREIYLVEVKDRKQVITEVVPPMERKSSRA